RLGPGPGPRIESRRQGRDRRRVRGNEVALGASWRKPTELLSGSGKNVVGFRRRKPPPPLGLRRPAQHRRGGEQEKGAHRDEPGPGDDEDRVGKVRHARRVRAPNEVLVEPPRTDPEPEERDAVETESRGELSARGALV